MTLKLKPIWVRVQATDTEYCNLKKGHLIYFYSTFKKAKESVRYDEIIVKFVPVVKKK